MEELKRFKTDRVEYIDNKIAKYRLGNIVDDLIENITNEAKMMA